LGVLTAKIQNKNTLMCHELVASLGFLISKSKGSLVIPAR